MLGFTGITPRSEMLSKSSRVRKLNSVGPVLSQERVCETLGAWATLQRSRTGALGALRLLETHVDKGIPRWMSFLNAVFRL